MLKQQMIRLFYVTTIVIIFFSLQPYQCLLNGHLVSEQKEELEIYQTDLPILISTGYDSFIVIVPNKTLKQSELLIFL